MGVESVSLNDSSDNIVSKKSKSIFNHKKLEIGQNI
jgi:hypothetical protein